MLVNLVMAEAGERVHAAAEQRDVEIKLVEPSPPVAVLGDRRQLTSALYNLLENAVKFSYEGGIVEFTGTVDGDDVVVAVSDKGLGIPTRDLERIFERFYRVDHGRSRSTGGTGLGLSIVRHVANSHRGSVNVESPRGGGLDVHAPAPLARPRRHMIAREGSDKAGPGVKPIEVLLAEDEESFVDALVIGLEREGFAITVARDGAEALERFEESEPDLILLDIMLPKISGLDVCRTIRARSAVPIIMVTAKSTEIDTVVGLEVGADDYVAKPYRLHELVSRIARRAPARPAGGTRRGRPCRPGSGVVVPARYATAQRARGRRRHARPRPARVHRARRRSRPALEGVRAS